MPVNCDFKNLQTPTFQDVLKLMGKDFTQHKFLFSKYFVFLVPMILSNSELKIQDLKLCAILTHPRIFVKSDFNA